MSMKSTIRTEHSGGKNGGGYYGSRAEAKRVCRKIRRAAGKIDKRSYAEGE